MIFPVVARIGLLTLLCALSTFAEKTQNVTAASITNVTNSTVSDSKITTSSIPHNSLFNSINSSMIERALYVLIGITFIGVLYFLVRAVRLKETTTSRKKYGLLSNYDDSVEMAALESDEEDDTVYEARSLRR
ncbi:hypothetical protein UPYG_G00037350 [Umbra pygmaea]|uniref:Uncharacterized protein n=1 Tax=Umbra pygmaea TaxID=75934 RepID=A0ABD0XP87_UMBPY